MTRSYVRTETLYPRILAWYAAAMRRLDRNCDGYETRAAIAGRYRTLMMEEG